MIIVDLAESISPSYVSIKFPNLCVHLVFQRPFLMQRYVLKIYPVKHWILLIHDFDLLFALAELEELMSVCYIVLALFIWFSFEL